MYYIKDMTQAEIAKTMFITRTSISRLLKEAWKKKIVEVNIHYTEKRCYQLEYILKNRLNLTELYIYDDIMLLENETIDIVCKNTAFYIHDHLKEGMILGVSGGIFVDRCLQYMAQYDRNEVNLDLRLVQLYGTEANSEYRHASIMMIRKMLEIYGGYAYFMPAPLVVALAEMKNQLIKEKSIQYTLAMGRKCELVLTGLGVLNPEIPFSNMWNGYLTEKQLLELVDKGGVGNIFGRIYDINGKLLDHPINDRIVGIEIQDLKKNKNVTAVCCGKGRSRALLGAARGQMMNVVFTDRSCAEGLLNFL